MWHAARRLASSAAMRPLKVGFVGAGAVGTYFGVRLAELGHDVRFLVRKRHDAPERLCVKRPKMNEPNLEKVESKHF